MILSRDDILSADDIRRETVPVPEWRKGGEVWVRGMNARERCEFEKMSLLPDGRKDPSGVREWAAGCCTVDDHGVALFTKADIKILAEKACAPVERIFSKAMELSRVSAEDFEAAVSDLPEGQSTDSPTALPSPPADSTSTECSESSAASS
jgi:hypothetical protein